MSLGTVFSSSEQNDQPVTHVCDLVYVQGQEILIRRASGFGAVSCRESLH
jgi:hypothetical protein